MMRDEAENPVMRLGLVGENIEGSLSPRLHEFAGKLCGLDIRYERLVPSVLEMDFDVLLARCSADGFRGLNITYPYKERVIGHVDVEDQVAGWIRACNTVVFEQAHARGFNTDYSGFIRAFRNSFGTISPGIVAVVGAGGVGKAVSIALGTLGAAAVRIFDADRKKASALASALTTYFATLDVSVVSEISDAIPGSDGIVNCTPVGMHGRPGSAIPQLLIGGQSWAFDAVYIPAETQFLKDARAAGIAAMSGFELFFFQGIDAFAVFTGLDLDETTFRPQFAAHLREWAGCS